MIRRGFSIDTVPGANSYGVLIDLDYGQIRLCLYNKVVRYVF